MDTYLESLALTALPDQAGERQAEERRWIAGSLDGDRDAFGELVRRYQHRVFRLAGRFFRRTGTTSTKASPFLASGRACDLPALCRLATAFGHV